MKDTFNPQLKLFWNGDRVKDWLEGKKIFPILLEVDPTDYCNANCPWCRYRGHDKGINIEKESLMEVIKDLSQEGLRGINWTGGGEPTLHPDLNEMVRYAWERGVENGLFTNGISYRHRVNPKHFKWIRVSLTDKYFDATNRKLVEEYKADTKVGIVFNITPYNKNRLNECAKTAKEWGFDYFQARPALTREFKKQWHVDYPEQLKELEDDNFKVFLSDYKFDDYNKRPKYKYCYGYHFCPVIDHRGDVRICNYFLDDDDYKVGNIYEEPIREIIKKMPEKIVVTDKCQSCCKNNEINKVLYKAKTLKDTNFI